jgi:glutathione synthase/RimK-type ligase-like ATP-grasp enzyme
VFIKPGKSVKGLVSQKPGPYDKFNNDALDNLFETYFAEKDKDKAKDAPTDKPVIYYGGTMKDGTDFLENSKIPKANLYNTPELSPKTGDKKKFHIRYDEVSYVPKTVYEIDDVKDALSFPIIAKPAEGHSGVGIEIFKTFDELKKSKNKFDLYSQALDFNYEFRVFLMKDKIVEIDERVHKKGVADKKNKEAVDFVYVELDTKKFPHTQKMGEMAKFFYDDIKPGVWSMDVVLDKDGKLWVLELNSATGMGASKLAYIYTAVYEDFYNKTLPRSFHNTLNEKFIKPIRKINWRDDKKSIQKSKWAIDYEELIK